MDRLSRNTSGESRQEYPALNWLRFVLAVYLVFFHTLRNYDQIAGTWIDAFLGLGNLATTVFFILSGFLLTHAYVITKNAQAINARQFLISRLATLYPIHLIGLMLALLPLCATIYAHGGVLVPVVPRGPLVRMLGDEEILLAAIMNIMLLNAWNPSYLIINPPSWSLSALLCYYLIFPFVVLKIYRARKPGLQLLGVGALFILPGLCADLLNSDSLLVDGLLHRNPVFRIPLFISGILLCAIIYRGESYVAPRIKSILAAGVITTIALAGYWEFHAIRPHIVTNGLYLPAGLAIVYLCAIVRSNGNRTVQYWARRLGSSSLPMFLLHVPLYQCFVNIERLWNGALVGRSISSVVTLGRKIEPNISFYPLYLTLVVMVSLVAQERFVIPIQKMIRDRMDKRRVAVTVAGL